MDKFYCAAASRQAGEDMIGSATPYATYVLIECSTPWDYDAFTSPGIPQNLRDLIQEVQQAKLSIRFLLIARNHRKTSAESKLLIYQQEQQPFVGGYRRSEWDVASIDQVAGVVQNYLAGDRSSESQAAQDWQDILICTHGIHDQCCAKYGIPFYRQAITTLSNLNLSQVRVWKASHFGGHRFAPTAIGLPDGRYYGALNDRSFQTLLTHTGDIQAIAAIYRGWGVLPTALQVLERTLMLRYGWDWFNYKISHTVLEQSESKDWIQAELMFEQPNGTIYTYQAQLIQDFSKTLCLKGSCSAEKLATFVKYRVEQLQLCTVKLARLRA